MRPLVQLAFVTTLALAPAVAAASPSWVAGGTLSLAWARGWPELDLRGRLGYLVGGGHELGLGAGIHTRRLATELHYHSSYTHTWLGGRRWPLVSLWIGGLTTLAGNLGQSRLVLGVSAGLRLPLGPRATLRIELGHELRGGSSWSDHTFLTLGLELIGGSQWRPERRGCYPRPRASHRGSTRRRHEADDRDRRARAERHAGRMQRQPRGRPTGRGRDRRRCPGADR